MNLQFASYSDKGGRERNEDSILTVEKDGCALLAAADGVGGYADGAEASGKAVEMLREAFLKDVAQTDLRQVLHAVNSCLWEESGGKRGLTTVTAALITPERILLAHVGDSRIYAFRDGEILHQTIDHSVAQMAVFRGEITLDGIRSHEDRSVLTQAVGASENIRVDTAELAAGDADALLLCTDGFWEYILEADMTAALGAAKTPEDWLQAMRDLLPGRVPKRHDNNSAVAAMLNV